MQKKKKRIFAVLLSAILVVALTSCSKLGSIINEIHGSLIGNNYTVYTYDNYGNQTLKTSGKKISITGNKIETVSYDSDGRAVTGYDLSSVITITIDGKEIESCGDTCVFVQNGLKPEVDFSLDEVNSNGGNGITDNAALARVLNRYKNDFGKSRVVVIKSQLGQPIAAFSGDNVYWEIPDDLPKMTKLMVDGKALYIHRANYQIIDKDLL
ncbi:MULTISPECIES: DUF5052 family protein [unclassified Ruminococcus]|uniref:DUF5052 family protein n=1 Tax=unclassified Ruminococcus TaxID=2608920 RepID=UPI0018AC3866|nr:MULTISPECIES: DUF5052 family protein [unclassified Ruminococcus]MDB8777712.1 DUF5052 family protein [Ruminococcus sp. 1001136sp1]